MQEEPDGSGGASVVPGGRFLKACGGRPALASAAFAGRCAPESMQRRTKPARYPIHPSCAYQIISHLESARLRRASMTPARPTPNKASDAGSGTGVGVLPIRKDAD